MAVLWRTGGPSLSSMLPLTCKPQGLRGVLLTSAGLVLAVPGPRQHAVRARAAAEGLQQRGAPAGGGNAEGRGRHCHRRVTSPYWAHPGASQPLKVAWTCSSIADQCDCSGGAS